MSQNSDEEYSAAEPRRGRRKKKLSQRAADAIQAEGEVVPGISPDRPQSSDTSLSGRIPFLSTPKVQSPARGLSMANQSKVAKPTQATMKARPVDAIATVYGLGPDQFAIYFWQVPRPKDFLDLPESRRSWKARIDKVEKQRDIDDGADDWQGFDNTLSDRGIASCFMKRAKRAFWAGKSWKEFEDQERNLSSVTVDAGGEKDPEALENDRRMRIFGIIKVRLCEEIWLEPYVPELSKKDSKLPIRINTPTVFDNDPEPTEEERSEGIARWTRNPEGVAEPWYEGETPNPAGIQNGIQDYQEQRSRSDKNFQQQRRGDTVVPPIGNISAAGPFDLRAEIEVVASDLDLSESDEGA